MDIYEELIRERSEGRVSALVTIVNTTGSIPSNSFAKMLVREDGTIVGTIGGGAAEGRAIAAAREVMAEDRARLVSFKLHENPVMDIGMICGGSLDLFIEPITPLRRVYIFGGGHLGLVVERLARSAGFATVVIDDRAEFASPERFPQAQTVLAGSVEETTRGLVADSRSLVFIATRGHFLDGEALRWALSTPAGYIGMIGSRRKIQTLYRRLIDSGVAEAQFERVRAPVGFEIGAVTPEEIGIAVMAEMIAHARRALATQVLERRMSECMRSGSRPAETDGSVPDETRGAA
jgi:xanthine dehydrogenase accessory factor